MGVNMEEARFMKGKLEKVVTDVMLFTLGLICFLMISLVHVSGQGS